MNRSSSRGQRGKVFLWIVLGCIVLAVGYTAWVLRRANASAGLVETKPLSVASTEELHAMQSQPHLVFLAQAKAPYGQVSLVGLDPEASSAAQTALQCDRIHYASGNGLCLMYDTAVSLSDPLAPPQVRVCLLGSVFQRLALGPDSGDTPATIGSRSRTR